MLDKPIENLKGKNVALVAMGQSQIDYHLSQVHSVSFDEVWAVNAMIGVLPKIDRAFILDPMSRFFDTEDAGSMTSMMRKHLPEVDYPIYTCELDNRVPYAEEFPLAFLVADLGCAYFNNTVAYAIAFALWNKINSLTVDLDSNNLRVIINLNYSIINTNIEDELQINFNTNGGV